MSNNAPQDNNHSSTTEANGSKPAKTVWDEFTDRLRTDFRRKGLGRYDEIMDSLNIPHGVATAFKECVEQMMKDYNAHLEELKVTDKIIDNKREVIAFLREKVEKLEKTITELEKVNAELNEKLLSLLNAKSSDSEQSPSDKEGRDL